MRWLVRAEIGTTRFRFWNETRVARLEREIIALNVTRRGAARTIAVAASGVMLNVPHARGLTDSTTMLTRAIPSSGEKLPIIGLGTWQTFDVGSAPSQRKPLEEVLAAFARLGGRVVDSSPMYGHAEEVVGDIAADLRLRDKLFFATKVWTRGREAGVESMERSCTRLRTRKIDLLQVHNLLDLDTHLATLREWKTRGRIRYLGITHYNESAFSEVEQALAHEKLDFLQINYSIMERAAEKRILPLAQQRGVAVLVNRPFGGGDLFRRVRGTALPDFAREIDCASWAQFFLKWIVSHPAVTCVIPATNNLDHLTDNMGAGLGRLPDESLRARMAAVLAR